MEQYHIASRDEQGVRPLCGASRKEPVLTDDDFRTQAKTGQPVCDRCVALATARHR